MNHDYSIAKGNAELYVTHQVNSRGYWARMCRLDREFAGIAAQANDLPRVAKWLRFACESHKHALTAQPALRRPLP